MVNKHESPRKTRMTRPLAWLSARRFFREGHAWHGLQLAASIALAYAAATGLRLPEAHWAVMSALIVGRADAGATLSAGWQRLGATLGGAFVGVVGAALMQAQLAPPAMISLVLVAALCFATADRIGWRSASIAALIVMTAAGQPSTPAVAVAGLRTVEVGIGACAAMFMAWLAHRLSATTRPLTVVSELLRQMAGQIEAAVAGDARTRIARSTAVRTTRRRLGEMLHGTQDARCRRLLLLSMRLAQDAGWLARQMAEVARESEAQARSAAADVSCALRAAASTLEGSVAEAPAALAATAALAALDQHTGPAWRADAVQVLQTDLRKLSHLAAQPRRSTA